MPEDTFSHGGTNYGLFIYLLFIYCKKSKADVIMVTVNNNIPNVDKINKHNFNRPVNVMQHCYEIKAIFSKPIFQRRHQWLEWKS